VVVWEQVCCDFAPIVHNFRPVKLEIFIISCRNNKRKKENGKQAKAGGAGYVTRLLYSAIVTVYFNLFVSFTNALLQKEEI